MVTAGALLMLLGLGFILITMTAAVVQWYDWHLVRRLRRATRPAMGELSIAASLPRWVLVTGRVAPGPEGVLASAAFGTECVWYRTIVTSGNDDDAVTNYDDRTGPRTCRLDRSAGGPTIRVSDGTGSVDVRLRKALHDLLDHSSGEALWLRGSVKPPAGSGLARLERHGLLPRSLYPRFGSRHIRISEDVITAGAELTVLGRPRRLPTGTMRLRRRGAASSPHSPQDWLAQLEYDMVGAASLLRHFPVIGLALVALGVALMWAGAGAEPGGK